MKRRFLALLCALCLLAGTAHAEEERITYDDIAGDEWFVPAVDELTQKGIMTGVEEHIFGPYRPVTRATVILVLWRLEGSPDAAVEEPFPDTEPWFETAAAWAKGYGVASGYPDGTFGGRDTVTREQMACFLYRYAQFKGDPLAEGALGLFSDADAISDWAQDAMAHAAGVGILQGGDDGRLDPHGITNRAALAVMIQRMLTPAAG